RQAGHAFAHPSHPAHRNAPYVADVERGDTFSLQQIVKSLRLGGIPGGFVTMLLAVAEGPTHLRRIRFCPPAIELRKAQAAVDQHLHAACAACFPRASRGVDQDLHPPNESFCHQHVVITEKDRVSPDLRPSDEAPPLLDHRLPGQILGCALPARISWTGRCGLVRIRTSLSGSCRSRL